MSQTIDFMHELFNAEECALIFEDALSRTDPEGAEEARFILRAFGHRVDEQEGRWVITFGDGRLIAPPAQIIGLPRRATTARARKAEGTKRRAGRKAAAGGVASHSAQVIPFPQSRIVRVASL